MIHLYQSDSAPPNRRWIAQFERIKDNLYLTIQGPTADIAMAKARLMLEFQALDPKDRKAFNLKDRLAALGDETDYEDLL